MLQRKTRERYRREGESECARRDVCNIIAINREREREKMEIHVRNNSERDNVRKKEEGKISGR